MAFVQAHGADSGPTQRPMAAGALAGLAAAVPAGALLLVFGAFRVMAEAVFRLSEVLTAALLTVAFVVAGAVYGRLFGRAANDKRGGWLFGMSFGFALWVAAPVLILPLIGGSRMAAGTPATGFLVAFLAWGLTIGWLFPLVHRPLRAGIDDQAGSALAGLGPEAAAPRRGLLRQQPRTR